MKAAFLLLLVLNACTSAEVPWWESETPCPPGAEMVGTPWPSNVPISAPPGPLPIERRALYTRKYSAMCRTGDGFNDFDGQSISWWGNGQPQMAFLARDGGVAELTEWDEYGQQTHHRLCTSTRDRATCSGDRTWWHHTKKKGIEGSYVAKKPVGEWREWGPNGTLIGHVDFTDGTDHRVVIDTNTRLLVADIVGGADVSVAPSNDLQLPESTAAERPELAVNLVLTKKSVTIDGIRLGDWDSRRLEAAFLEELTNKRKEHETLIAKSDLPPFDGRLLVQAHRDLPYSRVAQILNVAAKVGYVQFDVVVENPLKKLPPFKGPPRTQMWTSLSAFSVILVAPDVPGGLAFTAEDTVQEAVRKSDRARGESTMPLRWQTPLPQE